MKSPTIVSTPRRLGRPARHRGAEHDVVLAAVAGEQQRPGALQQDRVERHLRRAAPAPRGGASARRDSRAAPASHTLRRVRAPPADRRRSGVGAREARERLPPVALGRCRSCRCEPRDVVAIRPRPRQREPSRPVAPRRDTAGTPRRARAPTTSRRAAGGGGSRRTSVVLGAPEAARRRSSGASSSSKPRARSVGQERAQRPPPARRRPGRASPPLPTAARPPRPPRCSGRAARPTRTRCAGSGGGSPPRPRRAETPPRPGPPSSRSQSPAPEYACVSALVQGVEEHAFLHRRQRIDILDAAPSASRSSSSALRQRRQREVGRRVAARLRRSRQCAISARSAARKSSATPLDRRALVHAPRL